MVGRLESHQLRLIVSSRKRLKRDEILNQPIIEEYQDFDIQFLQVEE